MDWPSVANTFIATLPMLITAIGGVIAIWRKVEATHQAVNGKMGELLAVTKKGSADAATIAEKDAQGRREIEALRVAKEN